MSTPTADAVLDAVLEAMRLDDARFATHGAFGYELQRRGNEIVAWKSGKGRKVFPATRDGLVSALIFAGLAIEGGESKP